MDHLLSISVLLAENSFLLGKLKSFKRKDNIYRSDYSYSLSSAFPLLLLKSNVFYGLFSLD